MTIALWSEACEKHLPINITDHLTMIQLPGVVEGFASQNRLYSINRISSQGQDICDGFSTSSMG